MSLGFDLLQWDTWIILYVTHDKCYSEVTLSILVWISACCVLNEQWIVIKCAPGDRLGISICHRRAITVPVQDGHSFSIGMERWFVGQVQWNRLSFTGDWWGGWKREMRDESEGEISATWNYYPHELHEYFNIYSTNTSVDNQTKRHVWSFQPVI